MAFTVRTHLLVARPVPFAGTHSPCKPFTAGRAPKQRSCTVRAIALPPAPTLIAVTAASNHPLIPEAIRGPPASFLATALLVNVSLLPPAASFYNTLIDVAPAAVCLLVMRSKKPATFGKQADLSSLMIAFLVGAVGTTIGAVAAGSLGLLPPAISWRVAAAFAATYIGGAVNYVGVVNALDVPAEVAAAGLAADLGAMAVYFGGLFVLAARVRGDRSEELPAAEEAVPEQPASTLATLLLLVVPIVLTICIALASRQVSQYLALPAGVDLLLMSVTAGALGRWRRIRSYLLEAPRIGEVVITAFFAALGATARLSAVASASPGVLGIACVVLAVHALIMAIVGRLLLRLPARQLLLASNANIGGASTAAAFAVALGWRRLVSGAVLVGTIGYLLGTPVGLLIFAIARRALSGV